MELTQNMIDVTCRPLKWIKSVNTSIYRLMRNILVLIDCTIFWLLIPDFSCFGRSLFDGDVISEKGQVMNNENAFLSNLFVNRSGHSQWQNLISHNWGTLFVLRPNGARRGWKMWLRTPMTPKPIMVARKICSSMADAQISARTFQVFAPGIEYHGSIDDVRGIRGIVENTERWAQRFEFQTHSGPSWQPFCTNWFQAI